jgi:uncharacterized protein YjiS (DUF1127 family)
MIMAYILDLPRVLPERSIRGGACLALGRMIVRAVRNRTHAWMVWRTVENLQRLDDRTLADIGMHRSEIEWKVRELMPRYE